MKKKSAKPEKAKTALTPSAPDRVSLALPAGYIEWLHEMKARIRAAQIRAALSVNRETIVLYWQIGRDILERRQQQGWGAKVIERLSFDLREAFPDMKGWSSRNLKYMRAFAAAWPDEQFVQQVVAQIPWFHHCVLLEKLKEAAEREWYIRKTIEHGWSRDVLVLQIESRLMHRQGKAVTNFAQTLPSASFCARPRTASSPNTPCAASKSRLAFPTSN